MRQICFPIALFTASCLVQAQTASNPMSADVRRAYEAVKGNLLKSIDKIPQADYSFKPTPESRSMQEILEHVAMAQTHTCASVSGGSAPPASDTNLAASFKQSFALCDKAYESLTDASAAESVNTPRGQRTRIGILTGNTAHDTEQYAILSVYMRLKGLTPPSSERPGGK